jgi:putative membrane protein
MSFIVTVLMVLLVDSLMAGFNTAGFLSALIFAVVLSLVKMVMSVFTAD